MSTTVAAYLARYLDNLRSEIARRRHSRDHRNCRACELETLLDKALMS
jgi:hypothetical protein